MSELTQLEKKTEHNCTRLKNNLKKQLSLPTIMWFAEFMQVSVMALPAPRGKNFSGTVCPRPIYSYSPCVRQQVQTFVGFTDSFYTSSELKYYLTPSQYIGKLIHIFTNYAV